jgi:N6-L-threonylcarbamoyladenine synthase
MTTILGIETSCDETGIAIYNNNKGIIANQLYSQIDLHNAYGGVVPELASRDHIRVISILIKKALFESQIPKNKLDAIAYTFGPGLNGALLVGATVANSFAYSIKKPVIPIHHLEGHILSTFLSSNPPSPPFITLLVSGGHSQLILVNKIGQYKVIGDTLDDAAGETFDKSAKMLGLPYPGGQHIAEYAKSAILTYDLPRPMYHSQDLTMSFSGLKTAVLLLIKKLQQEYMTTTLSQQIKSNIAKSVEEAITDVLVKKSITACTLYGVKNLVVSGGVSANITLRTKLEKYNKINTFYPPLSLCTDNGAMIAIAGYTRHKNATYNYKFSTYPRFLLQNLEEIK